MEQVTNTNGQILVKKYLPHNFLAEKMVLKCLQRLKCICACLRRPHMSPYIYARPPTPTRTLAHMPYAAW